jgi:hypothetical protein
MKWKNKDTNEVINIRKYNKLSATEQKNWTEFDENKVEHGDIGNTLGGGLIGEDSERDDDDQ